MKNYQAKVNKGKPMPRPNILFVFTDQQAASAMSCAGNPHLHTPHMDALAAAGTRFTQAYCAAPVCGPSRSSLATGLLPHQTGVLVNGMVPAPDIPTVGELFQDAGYHTAWSGRWHLPGNDDIRGFETLHDPDTRLGLGAVGDGPVTDAAIDFINRPHDRPFFLGVSLCNPHDICHWIVDPPPLPAPTSELPPLPDNFAVDPDESEFIQHCRRRTYYGQEGTYTRDWDQRRWRHYLHAYYRFTEAVDLQLGRLLETLRQKGLQDDTLVLFTSDHGEGLAAHRWVVKLMLYEEETRVPFIVRWPGKIPAGAVDDRLVSGIDVVPSLCDWAGIDCPPVTGTSLSPLVQDADAPGRPFVVTQLYPDTKDLALQGRMLRTPRYKYIAFSHGARPELFFDLENDPGETINLTVDPERRTALDHHRALLRDHCRQTDDPFVAGVSQF